MPLVALTTIEPKTFSDLCRGVRETFLFGQQRAEEIKVQTYWETGRLIHVYGLHNEKRADYGSRIVPRLARALKANERTLYQCLQFYRAYPILNPGSELSWGHYRVLSQVTDTKERGRLTKLAIDEQWTTAEMSARVASFNRTTSADESTEGNGTNGTSPIRRRPLVPRQGTPGLYRVIADGEDCIIDLGFKFYRRVGAGSKLKPDDIVRIGADRITRVEATKAELFTYSATLRRVVDGDTLLIAIDVAPDIFHTEKLRLRGLDCPELSTVEGKVAKRFTESLLPADAAITVSTTKPDKYDRYLADVFVRSAAGETVFLNNALLDGGYAERKDEWEFGDWGF